MKKNESGRSMLEMLAIMVILGILVAGAFAGYNQAILKYRYGQTITQINDIIRDVQTSCRIFRSYLKCESAGVFTEINTDYAVTPFGIINGYSFTTDSTNKNKLTITVSGLPEEVCSELKNETFDGIAYTTPSCSFNSTGYAALKVSID